MSEIVFIVQEDLEGGYTAKAVDKAIFTEADSVEELKNNIKEAIDTHFDEDNKPTLIKLHYTREEVFSYG